MPAVYPPLVYLLVRMLVLMGRPPTRPPTRPRAGAGRGNSRGGKGLHLLVPAPWLAIAVVFLIGFRVALNVTDSNVVDVGYAGVIGAERIVDGKPMYGGWPRDNEHGDTYGPVNYVAYVPFQQVFGWSGTWDDLPAAHAAAIFFDLLSVGLLFLIGRRMRGPTLGIALAYAWVSFPFTLFALESNTNDTLVGAMVLLALLAATYRSTLAAGARGAAAVLAGLTKFAPLALAPLLATDALRAAPRRRRPRVLAAFLAGFLLAARWSSGRRSRTTRCGRSGTGRSPTSQTVARRSRSGACTGGTPRGTWPRGRRSRSRSCWRWCRGEKTSWASRRAARRS